MDEVVVTSNPSPKIPCSRALAAFGVPAVRWQTRADLLKQLELGREHLDNAPIDRCGLEETAEVAGLSNYHFLRLFKSVYGITPQRYLKRRRIRIAQESLASGATVLEAAVLAGFSDPSSFSRAFKLETGTSPGKFKSAI